MNHRLHLDLSGVQFAGSLQNRNAPLLSLGPSLDPGCHAIVTTTSEQADALILSCAGLQPAARGRVKLGSQDPYTTPKLRAQIVSLLAQELAPEGWPTRSRCSELFSYLFSIEPSVWSDHTRRASLLERLALYRERPVHSLDGDERRLIMLEFALAHPSPQLALLYEPWSALQTPTGQAPERRLLDELNRLVSSGCMVVLFTLNEEQAERYSARLIKPSQLKPHRANSLVFLRRGS